MWYNIIYYYHIPGVYFYHCNNIIHQYIEERICNIHLSAFSEGADCTSGSPPDSTDIRAEFKSYLIDVTLSTSLPMISQPHNNSISSRKTRPKGHTGDFQPYLCTCHRWTCLCMPLHLSILSQGGSCYTLNQSEARKTHFSLKSCLAVFVRRQRLHETRKIKVPTKHNWGPLRLSHVLLLETNRVLMCSCW